MNTADGVCETFHCCPAGAFGTDVILVEFSPGISEQAVAKLVAALGASVSRHFEHIDVYVIAVPHGSELEMVARFNERPEVEVAYVNSIGCIPESWGCACCPPSERIICPNLPPCLPP
jgi:hypothetical protein